MKKSDGRAAGSSGPKASCAEWPEVPKTWRVQAGKLISCWNAEHDGDGASEAAKHRSQAASKAALAYVYAQLVLLSASKKRDKTVKTMLATMSITPRSDRVINAFVAYYMNLDDSDKRQSRLRIVAAIRYLLTERIPPSAVEKTAGSVKEWEHRWKHANDAPHRRSTKQVDIASMIEKFHKPRIGGVFTVRIKALGKHRYEVLKPP